MELLTKLSFMVFFVSLFYTLYHLLDYYLIYKEIKKDKVWLETKQDKYLFFFAICYVFTVIFTGVLMF